MVAPKQTITKPKKPATPKTKLRAKNKTPPKTTPKQEQTPRNTPKETASPKKQGSGFYELADYC
jgi:hypothetical protein